MQKSCPFTLLLLLIAISVSAQRGHRPPASDQRAEKIELTAEQRAEIKKIREEARAATRAVLTPEQRTQLDAKRAARAAEREARRERYETEILPVLRAARGQLDAQISAADRATIDRLREVFATRPGKEIEDREARRTATAAWREEHRAELTTLRELTDRYAADIERVQRALEGTRRNWQQSGDRPERAGKRGRSGDHKGRPQRPRGMSKARFLLLKP